MASINREQAAALIAEQLIPEVMQDVPKQSVVLQSATPYALDGASIYFSTDGGIDDSVAQMIAGDFSQLVYSIRKDVEIKVLDQAAIFDPSTKTLLYALAQQNMIALMLTFRMGWALPNPATVVPRTKSRIRIRFVVIRNCPQICHSQAQNAQ